MRSTWQKLREALFPIYGEREGEAIIREIFNYEKGWGLTEMIIHGDDELSDYIKGDIDKILQRLLRHEPIQYITGEASFYGLDIRVRPGVLIPRPETQELVSAVVEEWGRAPDLSVLDACCGSGCIAAALSRNLKFPTVTALDLSDAAVEVTRENIEKLRCRVEVVQSDIFTYEPAPSSLDVIVSNPPYIDEGERGGIDRNVLEYEPEMALFVPDSDPLRFYERLADIGISALRPDGMIYFEINPRHKDDMLRMMETKGYTEVEAWRDTYGKYRFVKARRNG